MCGIFGVFGQQITEETGFACIDRLAHRGPDRRDLWQEEDVTLGHRRLSIMDLSDRGKQPMSDPTGRYYLVFNGEIYNFLEIRKELEAKGCRFLGDSDSEVLLHAYIEWGPACQDRFNGMWAFAVYDRKERELFLSRDRFGVKPLYYILLNGSAFAFASEMKALTPLMEEVLPNRELVCDPNRIVYYESTEECVIKGIHRLPAGHCMFVRHDSGESRQWWNTLDHLTEVPDTYEEQTGYMRSLFLDACKLRMRSDVTIGTALSGGLDSSATICAMAHLARNGSDARMNKDWQHAYVATFPGTTMDESAYARCVTDHLDIPATFVKIDPVSAIDSLDDMIYLFEDVYLTSPIPMMLLYRALREDGTYVTIDGHGADELFGGYTFDFINALRDAKTKEEKDWILTAYVESFPKDGSNIALKSTGHAAVYRTWLKRRLKDYLRRHEEGYKKIRAAGDPRYEKMDSLNKILYASSHETILPTLLRNYDRYSMASSVEIRMPFMDYRIVTYALSLGFRSKIHGGYSKSVIRDAMAPYMPKEIAYRRTKIGFNTPVVEWMKGPLKPYFTDILASQDFINCDLIDASKVREEVLHVIEDPAATFAMGEKAWSDLYPYLWERAVLRRAK
ncbi:MAG: asparagine synthase (glutamine-hydrolyzing) [Lachnospiraceae bacterium]|nr:asparagine synthase (glutamine-hydrolyzing) [Lachnospiraceae bacterium]